MKIKRRILNTKEKDASGNGHGCSYFFENHGHSKVSLLFMTKYCAARAGQSAHRSRIATVSLPCTCTDYSETLAALNANRTTINGRKKYDRWRTEGSQCAYRSTREQERMAQHTNILVLHINKAVPRNIFASTLVLWLETVLRKVLCKYQPNDGLHA